ncbi:MAG: glycosyltransferase family 87 protein [Legionellaceae bacterium]|nr:glycosyltransferase family 87 protein [Legionellaceae bacterium]
MPILTSQRNQHILFLILLIVYGTLFYFITTDQLRLDFSSFYSASNVLSWHANPYQVLQTTYFPTIKYLSPNPNPPSLLMLFIPLSKLNYHTSVIIWYVLSLTLGVITALTAFALVFSQSQVKQHKLIALILFFSLFSTLIDTATMQLGSFTAFFLIIGYYVYKQGHFVLAAVLWGIIASLKIFPCLLLFYILRQRHYKMLAIMIATLSISWLIPWFIYGTQVYSDYFKLLPHMLWFGDSWNASLYGFLFRLFVDGHDKTPHLLVVQSLYGLLSMVSLLWYFKSMKAHQTRYLDGMDNKHHQPFCLTLVMMLFLSPMGWIYYFPLIFLPMLVTWSQSRTTKPFIGLVCLFLINFPMGYVMSKNMTTLFEKLTLYSFPFYGLLLLIHLLSKNYRTERCNRNHQQNLMLPITSILAFGIVVVLFSLLWRFHIAFSSKWA